MLAILLLILFPAAEVQARQRTLPLIPPKNDATFLEERNDQVAAFSPHEERKPESDARLSGSGKSSSRSLWGVEAVSLGRANRNSGNLGFQMYWGARGFTAFRVFKRIYLKPTLGYLFAVETLGKVTAVQHMLEGGLLAHYLFARGREVSWFAGLTQRVEALFANASVSTSGSSSQTVGPAFLYRLGPSVGFTTPISPKTALSGELETTIPIGTTMNPYVGLSLGLVF